MTRHNGPGPVEPGSGVEPSPPFGGGGNRSGANAGGDEPGAENGAEHGRRKPGRPPGQAPISDEQASGELTGLWDIPFDAKAKEWDRQLRKDYGLPGWLWHEVAAEQDHRCPLCLTPMEGARKRPPLDHAHDGEYEVFGLPCDGCNRLLDSGFRERVLAYLTDPPARRVGMRLYGRPLRVPRVRAERLEAKRAKRRAAGRSGSARTARAAGRVRRAAQARTTAPAPAAAETDFSSQLDALMGRAARNQNGNQAGNQAGNQMEGRPQT
jgi:hypothetical protein